MVLCKIVGQVEFAGGPDKIELALVDAIFHPPIAHVKGFGVFLAHFGVEHTLGVVVVGFKGGAGGWLLVAEFVEVHKDGAGMFSACVDAAGFSLGCRGDDIFECFAQDVKGSIDAVTVEPAEVIVGGDATAGFRLDKVGGVGCGL
jgi:hypothetical protein